MASDVPYVYLLLQRSLCIKEVNVPVFYTLFLRYVSKEIINNLNEPPKIFLLSTYTSEIFYLTVNSCLCSRQKMTCFMDSTPCVYRVKWENTLK